MSFHPANTKWSVAEFNNDGHIGGFHPTPWEFHQESMNAGALWVGRYKSIPGSENRFACEILMSGATTVSDPFEVVFVTSDRFVATKNGALYRFGKKLKEVENEMEDELRSEYDFAQMKGGV